jgi:hypothetical protein
MNSDDVKEIVKSEIKKFVEDSLDKEIRKVLHNSNSQTREEMINTIRNAFDSVYKTLWQKKDFWKTDIR